MASEGIVITEKRMRSAGLTAARPLRIAVDANVGKRGAKVLIAAGIGAAVGVAALLALGGRRVGRWIVTKATRRFDALPRATARRRRP